VALKDGDTILFGTASEVRVQARARTAVLAPSSGTLRRKTPPACRAMHDGTPCQVGVDPLHANLTCSIACGHSSLLTCSPAELQGVYPSAPCIPGSVPCPSAPCVLDSSCRPRVRAKQITSAVDDALAVEQDLRSECERLIERLTVRLNAHTTAGMYCKHLLLSPNQNT
jgi:hypothetical protein